MPRPDYVFRKMTRADYPMFCDWLDQPHIGGWWSAGGTELRLIEQEMGPEGATGPTDMRIVELDGQPFAYVQDYDVRAYDMPHYTDCPQGSRAIDMFLGDPAYLGQGHAQGFLRQRATQLCAAGAPSVVVDPSPANTRAVATYRRAGFRDLALRPSEDGDPVLVMEFLPAARPSSQPAFR